MREIGITIDQSGVPLAGGRRRPRDGAADCDGAQGVAVASGRAAPQLAVLRPTRGEDMARLCRERVGGFISGGHRRAGGQRLLSGRHSLSRPRDIARPAIAPEAAAPADRDLSRAVVSPGETPAVARDRRAVQRAGRDRHRVRKNVFTAFPDHRPWHGTVRTVLVRAVPELAVPVAAPGQDRAVPAQREAVLAARRNRDDFRETRHGLRHRRRLSCLAHAIAKLTV